LAGYNLRAVVKNGTSTAVLVDDLLARDGPFDRVAEDFRERRCSTCGAVDIDDMRFRADAYLCPACWVPLVTS
jgi:hypothetical protein